MFFKEFVAVLYFAILLICLFGISYFFLIYEFRRRKGIILTLVIMFDIYTTFVYFRQLSYWGMIAWDYAFFALLSLAILNIVTIWHYRMKENKKYVLYPLYGAYAIAFIGYGLFFLIPELIRPALTYVVKKAS
jgi:hypothetical protein